MERQPRLLQKLCLILAAYDLLAWLQTSCAFTMSMSLKCEFPKRESGAASCAGYLKLRTLCLMLQAAAAAARRHACINSNRATCSQQIVNGLKMLHSAGCQPSWGAGEGGRLTSPVPVSWQCIAFMFVWWLMQPPSCTSLIRLSVAAGWLDRSRANGNKPM